MMPKICSQGYHFSASVCKSGGLRGFIFVTHHTKTMSRRIAASDWEDREWAHPAVLRRPSKGGLMLQVRQARRPLLLSAPALSASLSEKPLHARRSLGLLYVGVTSRVSDGKRHSISAAGQSGSPPAVSGAHRLRAWRRSHKLVLVGPGARANGLLTPRQAPGLRGVSHCQAALINSHNSWRDESQSHTGGRAPANTLTGKGTHNRSQTRTIHTHCYGML